MFELLYLIACAIAIHWMMKEMEDASFGYILAYFIVNVAGLVAIVNVLAKHM